MFLKSICLLSVAIMIITAFITETAMAKEGAQDDEWQFGVELFKGIDCAFQANNKTGDRK